MGGGGGAVHKGGTAVLELPAELVGELEKEAKRSRKSVAKLMAIAIEDLLDARAADAAYKRHLKSGGKTHTLDEVRQELGLAR